MSPVARTIVDQINSLDPRALFAWGARQFVYSPNSLQFNSTGMCKWKGVVQIVLNGNDLYDIRFMRIRQLKVVEDVTVTDIYAENLIRVLDAKIG